MEVASAFPKDSLEKVLRSVLESPHSSFYRKRFGEPSALLPLTKEHWESIPGMAREDVTKIPFWQRSYVPREQVHYTRNTSGFSGNQILITPRINYGDYTEPFKTLGVTRILSFHPSAHFGSIYFQHGLMSLFGDVGNLPLTSHIAKRMRVDGIYLAPYIALVFAGLLRERGILENIKMVQLCGERCSPLQFKTIKEQYPNATVFGNYASSETREAVAYPCVHDLRAGGSLTVEPVPEFYAEILDPATGKAITEYGMYGELALTTLTPGVPFPFVRYLTGDVAVWAKRSCICDNTRRAFEVIGRMTVFPVRLIKGEITIDAVESALHSLGVPAEYFEIHYTDESIQDKVLARVSVALVRVKGLPEAPELARALEEKLKVFPTYTYAQGVHAGLYLPLEISFIEKPKAVSGKNPAPIVVRHIAGDEASTYWDPAQRYAYEAFF